MAKTELKLIFDGQEINLKSGFVGGWMADLKDCPMGMYAGNLSIVDTNIALVHLLRAVIKMNTEEQFMNYEQSKALIERATKEAFKIEKENAPNQNVSLDQHNEIVLKMRKDNQN
jgi:hypothetical protein